METVRCACYTRKSSDDATLDRDFNSLTSQREPVKTISTVSGKKAGFVCRNIMMMAVFPEAI